MFPSGYASGPEEYIEKGKALHAKLAAEGFSNGRITLSWAPHAPYTVTDAHFLELKQLADEMGCTIHTHLHETAAEVECSCKLDSTSPQGMVRLRPATCCSRFHDYTRCWSEQSEKVFSVCLLVSSGPLLSDGVSQERPSNEPLS